MQDRVPLYPGRVKLTQVSGQENTYDMVRADAPTQDGTPLSKDTFLKDSTAALFGLGTDAVPDDALNILSDAVLYQQSAITLADLKEGDTLFLNETVDGTSRQAKFTLVSKDYNSTGRALVARFDKNNIIRSAWRDSTANVTYSGSTLDPFLNETYLSYLDADIQALITDITVPCYGGDITRKVFALSATELGVTEISYASTDGTAIPYFDNASKRIIGAAYWLRTVRTDNTSTAKDYACSVDGNGAGFIMLKTTKAAVVPALTLPLDFVVGYTPSIKDIQGNLVSIPYSQVIDGVKIATGSYVGTGTYGSSNPNSLTFDFEPKLVIIRSMQKPGWLTDYTQLLLLRNSITGGYTSSSTQEVFVSWAGNTVSWYNENGAPNQFNASNSISNGGGYVYCAIG